ncbi:MAG: hypothetical protein WB785_20105 [Mycobacterium sp.]
MKYVATFAFREPMKVVIFGTPSGDDAERSDAEEPDITREGSDQ